MVQIKLKNSNDLFKINFVSVFFFNTLERKYKSSIYPLLKIRINAKLLNEHINKYSKNIFQFFYYKRVKGKIERCKVKEEWGQKEIWVLRVAEKEK